MGIEPPYTATAGCLRAIAESSVVFSNVPGPEIDELLMVLCRDTRPLAYHQENDENKLAAAMMKEVRAGKTVAFVTRGNALVYGPLGAELVRRCRADGTAWDCPPSVSSAEALEARFGAGAPPRGFAVLDDRALTPGARVDPRLALTVYLTVERSPNNFLALCRRLKIVFGAKRPCFLLDRQVGQEPLRATIAELPSLWDRLTSAALLHVPAPGSCEPPPGAEPRLFFFGLGVEPKRDATIETIRGLRVCDRVYSGRAAARDERAILRDLESGLAVALATPAHPFSWNPLAAKLIKHCRRRGLAWKAFPSVSPAGAELSREGLALGTETLSLRSEA
jgi:hypothetical protein